MATTRKKTTARKSTARKSTARKSSSSARKTSGAVTVDLGSVEGRKGAKRYKEGDYAVKVAKAYPERSSGDKKTPQVVFEMKFVDGPYKGKTVWHRANMLPQSLWVFRNMAEACGIKIKKGKVKYDLKVFVGKTLGITIEDDEYNNKIRSRVTDTFPLAELEDRNSKEDDEELEEDDDEELDEEEDEDEEEDDEDEDEEDEEDEEEEDDEDEDDETEDEDDEEDLEDIDLEDV